MLLTSRARVNTRDLTATEGLFASLDTQHADLIVAGAFSHTDLRGPFRRRQHEANPPAIPTGADIAL